MSLYFISSCLGVSLVVMFGFRGRAIMYVRSVSADARIYAWRFKECLVWVSVHLVWLQIENLRDPYITELILESDSDAHSLENEDVSLRSDTDAGDIIDTSCTQWTDSTYCQPTVPVVHRLQGFQWV